MSILDTFPKDETPQQVAVRLVAALGGEQFNDTIDLASISGYSEKFGHASGKATVRIDLDRGWRDAKLSREEVAFLKNQIELLMPPVNNVRTQLSCRHPMLGNTSHIEVPFSYQAHEYGPVTTSPECGLANTALDNLRNRLEQVAQDDPNCGAMRKSIQNVLLSKVVSISRRR